MVHFFIYLAPILFISCHGEQHRMSCCKLHEVKSNLKNKGVSFQIYLFQSFNLLQGNHWAIT